MITVVMPTYNRAHLIRRSIDSVLGQNADLELIVVDDASRDNTEEIVRAINDPRLRYERLAKNQGACAARNRGVALARGEYIAFQDSDDVFLPGKLTRQLEALQANDADVVFCAFRHIGDDGDRVFPTPAVHGGFVSYNDFLFENLASTQTIFGKAECFRTVRFDESFPRLQDWELMLRVTQKYKVYYLDEILVDVYAQADSISSNPYKAMKALRMIEKMHGEAMNRDDRVTAQRLWFLKKIAGECGESVWKDFYKAACGKGHKLRYRAAWFKTGTELLMKEKLNRGTNDK